MKYIYLLIFFVIGCSSNENLDDNFGIVIHGGAGTISKENMTLELEEKYKNALKEAVVIGYQYKHLPSKENRYYLSRVEPIKNNY